MTEFYLEKSTMQIAGIQKTTLLDYPGKVATIIFTAGCNFRCRFCHNPEEVLPELIKKEAPHFIPEEAFFNFLKQRKRILDAVVICGGEPTLQPDLKNFAKKIKDYNLLVKVDTNGQDVQIIKEMLDEKLLDFVAMDIKSKREDYPNITNVKLGEEYFDNHEAMMDLLINSGVDHEFRTTVIKGYHNKENIKSIAKSITGAKRYAIQNFKLGKTLDPKFDGESFSQLELEDFKKIAYKYLEKVIIRN